LRRSQSPPSNHHPSSHFILPSSSYVHPTSGVSCTRSCFSCFKMFISPFCMFFHNLWFNDGMTLKNSKWN
jgi:hypothetical protein